MIPTAVSEEPISLSPGCVRAIRTGRKTLVRHPAADPGAPCPLGQVGDHLWVREPWSWAGDGTLAYLADDPEHGAFVAWQPARTMRREHSRLLLRIERLRAERLQQIADEEIARAGEPWREIPELSALDGREGFAAWWDLLHPRPEAQWQADPWVWVIGIAPVRAVPIPPTATPGP